MTRQSSVMRKFMLVMMALAVMFAYSVVPMNQAFAASKKPAQVKGLKATANSVTSVKLNWKKAKNAKKYQVYVATKKSGKYTKVATVKSSKKTYTVKKLKGKKLQANTKYYFKVRAINGKKNGKFSKVVPATTKKSKVPAVKTKTVYVTPKWLNSALKGEQKGYEDVVVCEVSYGKVADSYAKGHVPGAINVFSTEVEDATGEPGQYKAYNLLSVKSIRDYLIKKGITADTKVVLYDAGGDPAEVGRQAYGYIVAGVKDVKILNGDFAAWKNAGYKVEKKANKTKAVKSFGKNVKSHLEYWTSIEDAKAKAKNDDFKLVSIRSEPEWLGLTSGYGYMDKAGEPEGAVWGKGAKTAFDVADFVNEDGTVKNLNGFKAVWEGANFKTDGSQHLAFYCGTGWRATVPFLRLYETGITNISVFDGGWYEWMMNDDNPVQVGDPASPNCLHTTIGALPKEAAKAGDKSFVEMQAAEDKTEWKSYGIDYAAMDLTKDYILDVRKAELFAEGHFVGSVNADVATVNDPAVYGPELDKALANAGDKRIVIICNSGNALAARAMEYYRSNNKIENVKITFLIGGAADSNIPKDDASVWGK